MPAHKTIAAALSLDGLGSDARAAFDLAADAGYRAIAIPTNHPELRPEALGPSARRHIKRILDSKQLRVDALRIAGPRGGLADPASIDRTMDNVRRGMALAFDLGVATVAVNVGTLSGPAREQESWQAAARMIAEEADRAGLNVAFGADGAEQLGALIRHLDCPRALANLETARTLGAGADPVRVLDDWRGAVSLVTLADAIRAGAQVRQVELGQGQLALVEFITALRAREVLAPLVVDVRDLADGIHAAHTAAAVLRALQLTPR